MGSGVGRGCAAGFVVAEVGPRLSDLAELPLDRQLSWVGDGKWFAFEEPVEGFAVHQVGAHEPSRAKAKGLAMVV